MRALLCVVALAGCAQRAPVMLVANVKLEGYDLVIERCPVTSGDHARSFDAWRSCRTKRVRLPHRLASRPLESTSPDREDGYRRIGKARPALASCADEQALEGVISIELVLDRDGLLSTVEPAALADCVRSALGAEPFAVSLETTRYAFAVVVPEAP
jgi:hypothetical protein